MLFLLQIMALICCSVTIVIHPWPFSFSIYPFRPFSKTLQKHFNGLKFKMFLCYLNFIFMLSTLIFTSVLPFLLADQPSWPQVSVLHPHNNWFMCWNPASVSCFSSFHPSSLPHLPFSPSCHRPLLSNILWINEPKRKLKLEREPEQTVNEYLIWFNTLLRSSLTSACVSGSVSGFLEEM